MSDCEKPDCKNTDYSAKAFKFVDYVVRTLVHFSALAVLEIGKGKPFAFMGHAYISNKQNGAYIVTM